jgi:uncharacterized protein
VDLATLTVLVLVVMLIGLVLALVPGLPGVALIWLALLAFVLLDRFEHLSLLRFAFLTLLSIVGSTAELWGTNLLVHATGGSRWTAMLGSCLAFIGLVFFTLPIALLLALAAVFGVEWRRRRDALGAGLSSAGWLAGWGLAFIVEIAAAIAIILLFAQGVAT